MELVECQAGLRFEQAVVLLRPVVSDTGGMGPPGLPARMPVCLPARPCLPESR